MTYTVNLPVFEGPFDLLLHLISQREVDIFEVSLSDLTEDYLAALKQMQELDLEVATGFLLVAASLLEIKARRLLPTEATEDEDGLDVSDRDLLVAHLLQYKAFKEAADDFASRLDANSGYFSRTIGPGIEFAHLCPDILARVSVERFSQIAVEVLSPKIEPELDLSHLAPIGITIEEATVAVLQALDGAEHITFRSIAGNDRMEVVVHLLAVLEMLKAGTIQCEQTEQFGSIILKKARR